MPALPWPEFAEAAPDMAEKGRALIYQYGIGLGFIATVRKDGGPRLHPCCPIIHDDGLYVFVVGNSPKRYDLDRDGRYALHCNPPEDDDDEFYITGTAHRVADETLRGRLEDIAQHNVRSDEVLYELRIERALHTTWLRPRQPDTVPVYTRWPDSRDSLLN